MNESHVTRMGAISQTLLTVANSLYRKGDAMSITGNSVMANYHWKMAETLSALSNELNAISGELTAEAVQGAFRNSQNVLEAVLAGVSLAEKSGKPVITATQKTIICPKCGRGNRPKQSSCTNCESILS